MAIRLSCVIAGLVSLASCASAFALSEGRQWELVSPADKHGYAILPGFEAGGLTQSAASGDALTYISAGPAASQPSGNRALEFSQNLATRTSTGWASEDIATPNSEAAGLLPGRNTEYLMFSGGLDSGLVQPAGDTPLPPLASDAEETIYLRDEATKSFEAIVTAANVVAGRKFGEPKTANQIKFAGASPDLNHVLFTSIEGLTPGAERIAEEEGSAASYQNLYEWSKLDGQLQLVSVLPNKKQAAAEGQQSALGTKNLLVTNAVSQDGSRVVWSTHSAHGLPEGHIYLRDTSKEETVQLDVPEEGASIGGEPEPIFEGASADGSRIFFSDEQRLTPDSSATEGNLPDLYVFEVTSSGSEPLKGVLKDLTATAEDGELGESGGVQDLVLGYSEDATSVYFVAKGSLAAGASAGADNLYRDDLEGGTWTPSFIATLSGADSPDWGQIGPASAFGESTDLSDQTARVSPSGQYLAFMSSEPLTGYDNQDASSGTADEEVFLYDAATGHTVCASCHLAGGQPKGVLDTGAGHVRIPVFYDENEVWAATRASEPDPWLAAILPSWTSIGGTKAIYQSRFLLNSGQLFFDSSDALVPADADGQVDVYEYRPAGEECDSSKQSTSLVYETQAGGAGCVSLISSGTSAQESVFLDASENGSDVFLLTSSQLAQQDTDESFDVYDAHVCTGASPCPAPPAGAATPCSDEASCRGAGEVEGSLFALPSSALPSGGGNVAPAPVIKVVKPLTKAQKLAKALKACKQKKRGKKRSECESKAKKAFGPKKTARRHK